MTTPDSKLPISGAELNAMAQATFTAMSAADNARVELAMTQRRVHGPLADANTAATTVDEYCILQLESGVSCKIVGILLTTPIAVTASDSTYATVTVESYDSAGSTHTSVGSLTTKTTGGGGSGNITAFKPVAVPVTAANAIVPAGGCITVALAKASTGVKMAQAIAPAMVTVLYEEL